MLSTPLPGLLVSVPVLLEARRGHEPVVSHLLCPTHPKSSTDRNPPTQAIPLREEGGLLSFGWVGWRKARGLPKGLQRRERWVRAFQVALALGEAVVVAAGWAAALRPLSRLRLDLLLRLGYGVVVDVVVVDVLGGLLGDKSLTQEGAGGRRGHARLQFASWQAIGGAGAGAVPAHAGGLAAGGLQHAGEVLVQDGLGVLLVAAGRQERERVLRVLGVRHLPTALQAGRELRALLLLVLEVKHW